MKRLFLALLLTPVLASAQTAKEDADRALKGIDAFSTMQARTDPHYHAVEDVLLQEVDAILKSSPPAQWLPKIRSRYVALSDAEHAKEREAIRSSELATAAGLGYGDFGWNARMAQLEEELKAGKLGPRLHAIRAHEAAKIYHQGNHFFIAWRAAKVPIATEYELGAISRSEYEDRWNSTTTSFMDRQAADDRLRAQIGAQMAAEEYRAGLQSLELSRPRPMVKCSTSSAYGVTTTRCF